jgi:hypothetical protein
LVEHIWNRKGRRFNKSTNWNILYICNQFHIY